MSDDKNSTQTLVTEGDSQAQKQDAQESASLSRRKIFGAGVLGFAAVIAQACSGTDFASSSGDARRKGSKKSNTDNADGFGEGGQEGLDCDENDQECQGRTDNDDGGGGEAAGTDTNTNTNIDTLEDECSAYVTTEIDIKNLPDLDTKPTVKFYGRKDSALVAMKFDGSLGIDQVILTTPSGKMIALHGITGADKNDNVFRPIVIDNIWLKEAGKDLSEIYIVLQMGNERKKHKETIAFFDTYNNMPVEDLSQRSIPANWMTNQSVTQFKETAGSYNVDTNVTYPNDFNKDKVRNLQTVKKTSTWTKQGGIKGTVTDIMGETIDIDGGAIIEYQIFCTYVVSGGKAYRTILHIG